jgi:VWFA-related protein
MRHHLTISACLLLTAAALAAQEAAAPTPGTVDDVKDDRFFETVDVNVVNVEVFVTDKQGEPVTGLTKDDFEVFEDGSPVAITNFFTVEDGHPVLPEPETVAAAALPVDSNLPQAVDAMAMPEEQKLYLVVYVDNYNIRPFNRNRVFRRLREFLSEQLSQGDQVMLVSYDRELHYRHPFTSSPDLIARALFELEDVTGHAIHADSERSEMLRAIAEAENLGDVEYRVRTYAESMYNDLSFTVDAMSNLIDSLAGLPGRKALVYVSDGLPATCAEDMYTALNRVFHDTTVMATAQEFNANRLFERLAANANENRVTYYTIDAAGLRIPGGSSAEMATANEANLATFVDSVYINNLQAPLRRLAEATGGQAILNTNDVGDGLKKVGRDFHTYYSLGYIPAHSGDGRYYGIEVKLKEKQRGITVRHREGYRDKPLLARMSDGAMATLVYGYEENPLGLNIKVEGMRDDETDSKFALVDLVIEIPIKSLELVPIGEFRVGQAKVYFVAMDEEGGTSDVSEVPINLRIPLDKVETAIKQLYGCAVTLRMRRGPHRLAVGMVDEIDADKSFVSRSFVVGK